MLSATKLAKYLYLCEQQLNSTQKLLLTGSPFKEKTPNAHAPLQ